MWQKENDFLLMLFCLLLGKEFLEMPGRLPLREWWTDLGTQPQLEGKLGKLEPCYLDLSVKSWAERRRLRMGLDELSVRHRLAERTRLAVQACLTSKSTSLSLLYTILVVT